jgi:hypothetical protein
MSDFRMSKIISRSIIVPAPAHDIFELLADPRRHGEIDGSGSVKSAHDNAPLRLSLGATFGMDMRIGVPYRITNTVVEFEEDRRIAWRHLGGHVWRYVLEPTEGGTRVTEEFDWENNRAPLFLKIMRAQKNNTVAIEKTLQNLKARFGG